MEHKKTKYNESGIPELLNSKQLAVMLGVPEVALRKYRSSKTGPPYLKICGRVRYSVKSVIEYLKASEHHPEGTWDSRQDKNEDTDEVAARMWVARWIEDCGANFTPVSIAFVMRLPIKEKVALWRAKQTQDEETAYQILARNDAQSSS